MSFEDLKQRLFVHYYLSSRQQIAVSFQPYKSLNIKGLIKMKTAIIYDLLLIT